MTKDKAVLNAAYQTAADRKNHQRQNKRRVANKFLAHGAFYQTVNQGNDFFRDKLGFSCRNLTELTGQYLRQDEYRQYNAPGCNDGVGNVDSAEKIDAEQDFWAFQRIALLAKNSQVFPKGIDKACPAGENQCCFCFLLPPVIVSKIAHPKKVIFGANNGRMTPKGFR